MTLNEGVPNRTRHVDAEIDVAAVDGEVGSLEIEGRFALDMPVAPFDAEVAAQLARDLLEEPARRRSGSHVDAAEHLALDQLGVSVGGSEEKQIEERDAQWPRLARRGGRLDGRQIEFRDDPQRVEPGLRAFQQRFASAHEPTRLQIGISENDFAEAGERTLAAERDGELLGDVVLVDLIVTVRDGTSGERERGA